MDDFLSILILLFLISFLLSWIIPGVFITLFRNKLSKGKVRLVLGLATIFVFILFGVMNDNSTNNQKTATSQGKSVASNPQEVKKQEVQLSPEEIAKQEEEKAQAAKIAEEAKAKKDAEEKAKQEALAKPHFSDGNFVVGTDIQAGTYRTRSKPSACYYARLSGFSGELGEILANENTYYPAIVTIAPTDKGFKSSGCGTWTQDLSQITKDKTTFEDGMFIVGTDIEPGTYRSSGEGSCYYARLSGFSGSLGNISANENTESSAIVTITSSDKGFKSSGCGTWTKIK